MRAATHLSLEAGILPGSCLPPRSFTARIVAAKFPKGLFGCRLCYGIIPRIGPP